MSQAVTSLRTFTPQAEKSTRMRSAIVNAVIECLDEYGYVDTSISRVIERAKISRGALQHHFSNKEDLVVGVAEQLMRVSLAHVAVVPARQPRSISNELHAMWTRLIKTAAYRALLELLHAMRTNPSLRQRLSPVLAGWNAEFEKHALSLYESKSGSDEEVRELFTLCRCAFRGLIMQGQISRSGTNSESMVTRLIELVSTRLVPRKHGEPIKHRTTQRRRAHGRR